MIQESYCSFEISKLLKDKGFDELCIFKYNSEGIKVKAGKAIDEWSNTELEESECSAPTHQMVMRWLREVHNIFIEISTRIDTNGKYHFSYSILDKKCKYVIIGYTDLDWNYEEAVEAALKYVLETQLKSQCTEDDEKEEDNTRWLTWLEKQVSPDMVAEAYLRGCNDTEKKWIEKQGEQSNNEDVEKEKNDYVSGQFLYCKGSFNEFKEGESYWLEYVGNDNYIGRSDNILNQKFHITPRQLYTWLDPRHAYNCNETNAPTEQGEKDSSVKPPTFTFDDVLALQCCMETVKKVQEDKDLYEKLKDIHGRVYDAYQLEKQGEQKPFNYENANIQQKDFAPKVEPKYKAGDWIVSKYGDLFQIKEVVAEGYKLLCPSGNAEINSFGIVDKNSFLWSIAYARPGDILVTNQSIFIFKGFYIANKPKAYCGIMNGSFINCPEGCWTNEQCYPATEEQRKLLFEKMAEAGYEWDDEKKELTHKKVTKKSEHKGVKQGKKEMLDRVCKWLEEHSWDYLVGADNVYILLDDKMVSDLKKAMEDAK